MKIRKMWGKKKYNQTYRHNRKLHVNLIIKCNYCLLKETLCICMEKPLENNNIKQTTMIFMQEETNLTVERT